MIEIKSIADNKRAAAVCEARRLVPCCVLEMTEREETLGMACYEPQGERVVVHYLQAPDTALTDALLRATLNFARGSGANTAWIVHDPLIRHMRGKGYFSDAASQTVEISDFFEKSECKT